jgi:hypothetical protein
LDGKRHEADDSATKIGTAEALKVRDAFSLLADFLQCQFDDGQTFLVFAVFISEMLEGSQGFGVAPFGAKPPG